MSLRRAHGNAARHGALLVAETAPLDELPPLNAEDTAKGREVRKQRGRPFRKGNKAAGNRGPALVRIGRDLKPATDEERGLVTRRAATLRSVRASELSIQHGGMDLPSSVTVELVAWALDTSWSRFYFDRGDAVTGSVMAERASAHLLKAEGYASRAAQAEGKAKPRTSVEAARERVRGGP